MKIITHPANKHLVDIKIEELKPEPRDCIWFPRGVQVVLDEHMEKDKPTGKYKYVGSQNKFFTYWDGQGKPPSWCIYFGFVEEEREPLFYVMEKNMTFFDPFKSPLLWSKESMRMVSNYV
jgi:hypothetical protein